MEDARPGRPGSLQRRATPPSRRYAALVGDDGEDDLLTTSEAAKLLRISVPKLAQLAATGQVPCVRLGSRRVFYRRELLDLPRERPAVSTPSGGRRDVVSRVWEAPARRTGALASSALEEAAARGLPPFESLHRTFRLDGSIPVATIPRRRAWVQDPSDASFHIRRSPGLTHCRRRSVGWKSWRRQPGWTCEVCLVIDALPEIDNLRPGQEAVKGHLVLGRDWRATMPDLAAKVDAAIRRGTP